MKSSQAATTQATQDSDQIVLSITKSKTNEVVVVVAVACGEERSVSMAGLKMPGRMRCPGERTSEAAGHCPVSILAFSSSFRFPF